jgi:hypothetical protein
LTMATVRCCAPGCSTAVGRASDWQEALCRDHLDLASPEARQRFTHRRERLVRLEVLQNDERYLEAAFASDRHLKLCAVMDHASEMAEAAWLRVKMDVLLQMARHAGKTPLVQVWTAPTGSAPDERPFTRRFLCP